MYICYVFNYRIMENSTDDIAYYNDYNEESSNKTDTDIKAENIKSAHC